MRNRIHPAKDEGTTLVEVLVTFLVTIMFLGITYESIILGLRYYNRTNNLVQMTNIAEKQLALLQIGPQLESGDRTGRDGDYSWKLNVVPHPEVSGAHNVKLEILHHSRSTGHIWFTTLIGSRSNGR